MALGVLGILCGLLGGLFMLVGLIPFLGWLNWFTSVPTTIVGLVLSFFGSRDKTHGKVGVAGCILNGLVLLIALLRLQAGWGIL